MRGAITAVSVNCAMVSVRAAQGPSRHTVPIGIFLGRIEEGARISTPVRLLPFDHHESDGHQFPNALRLYGTELDPFSGWDIRQGTSCVPRSRAIPSNHHRPGPTKNSRPLARPRCAAPNAYCGHTTMRGSRV
jgi:hypothetical protein